MSSEYQPLDTKSIQKLLGSQNLVAIARKIGPSEASEILVNHNYDNNRAINKPRVDALAKFMVDGSFSPETSTINFSVGKSGNITLTDGQHRMTALVKSEKTYVFGILITSKSPAYVYGKTDRGRGRGLRDVIESSGAENVMGISSTLIQKIAVGLKVVKNNYILNSAAMKVNEDDMLKSLMNDYKEIALHIFDILYGLEFSAKLKGRTPMSLWLTLYKEFPKSEWLKIDEFIYGCATHDGLSDDDPRRWVYLFYSKYNRRGGSIRTVTMTKIEELGILLTAWDYWYLKKKSKRNFQRKTTERVLQSTPNVTGTSISYAVRLAK